MLLYAAQEDIAGAWGSGDIPDSDALDGALRAASLRVRHATRAARYDVGTDGKPSDPDVVEAFRDATVAQCLLWLRNGITPGAALQQPARQVASKSMGGRATTFTTDDPAVTAARAQAAKELCDDAALILSGAGLIGQPWAY